MDYCIWHVHIHSRTQLHIKHCSSVTVRVGKMGHTAVQVVRVKRIFKRLHNLLSMLLTKWNVRAATRWITHVESVMKPDGETAKYSHCQKPCWPRVSIVCTEMFHMLLLVFRIHIQTTDPMTFSNGNLPVDMKTTTLFCCKMHILPKGQSILNSKQSLVIFVCSCALLEITLWGWRKLCHNQGNVQPVYSWSHLIMIFNSTTG